MLDKEEGAWMNKSERNWARNQIRATVQLDVAYILSEYTATRLSDAQTAARIAADAAIRALSGKERKGLVVGEDWEEFNYLCKEHVVIWDTSTLPVRCVREYCDYTEDAHACAQNLCPRLRGKVANQ